MVIVSVHRRRAHGDPGGLAWLHVVWWRVAG